MDKINFPVNRFEEFMAGSIKGYHRTIVYVDGNDIRTAIAALKLVKLNFSKLVFLGDRKIIEDNFLQAGLKDGNIRIIEPAKSDKFEHYVKVIQDRFTERGKELSEDGAREMVSKPNYYASLMLKTGDAHGGVSGSLSSTEAMMKPLIQVIGTGMPKRYLSGAVLQIVPDCPYGLDGKFIFSDVAVIPYPDSQQMIDIVLESYRTAKALFDGEPKIAMLSYSTKGSAKGEKIDQIKGVIDEVRKIQPDIKIDGELQFDAAVVPEAARAKGGESEVAGKANVLIFPNLDSANICIKAVNRLAKTKYYGTIIQGSPIPFNDLSRGCDPVEILSMSLVTLMQIKEREEDK